MSDRDPKLERLVLRELRKDPFVRTAEIFAKAIEANPSLAESMTVRQFHGKYRLPAQKQLTTAGEIKGPKPARRKAHGARKRPATRSTKGGTPKKSAAIHPEANGIVRLVHGRIDEVREELQREVDAALGRARQSGQLSSFDALAHVLRRATESVRQIEA